MTPRIEYNKQGQRVTKDTWHRGLSEASLDAMFWMIADAVTVSFILRPDDPLWDIRSSRAVREDLADIIGTQVLPKQLREVVPFPWKIIFDD